MNYKSSLIYPYSMMTYCFRSSFSQNCTNCANCRIVRFQWMSMDPFYLSLSLPSQNSVFLLSIPVTLLCFCSFPAIFSVFQFHLCFSSYDFWPGSALSQFLTLFSLPPAPFPSPTNCKSFCAIWLTLSSNQFDFAPDLQYCSSNPQAPS